MKKKILFAVLILFTIFVLSQTASAQIYAKQFGNAWLEIPTEATTLLDMTFTLRGWGTFVCWIEGSGWVNTNNTSGFDFWVEADSDPNDLFYSYRSVNSDTTEDLETSFHTSLVKYLSTGNHTVRLRGFAWGGGDVDIYSHNLIVNCTKQGGVEVVNP